MSDQQLIVSLPGIDVKKAEEIDQIVKQCKLRQVNEIVSIEDVTIGHDKIDAFIESRSADLCEEEDRNRMRKIKFESHQSVCFSVCSRNSDGTYKIELIASKKSEKHYRVFIYKYKIDVQLKLDAFLGAFSLKDDPITKIVTVLLASMLMVTAIGPLLMVYGGVTLVNSIRELERQKLLDEESMKNYLVYKLANYANESCKLSIQFNS